MTRKHLVSLLLSIAASLAVVQPVGAQTNLKIGYVNVNALLQGSPQLQVINQQLRDEFAPREADLVALQQDLQKKLETYQRDASVMGEAEKTSLERDLQQGDRELQRRQNELQEDANIRQQELVNELQSKVADEVRKYAQAESYDLIVTNVVYASSAVDITAKVIASMGGTVNP